MERGTKIKPEGLIKAGYKKTYQKFSDLEFWKNEEEGKTILYDSEKEEVFFDLSEEEEVV